MAAGRNPSGLTRIRSLTLLLLLAASASPAEVLDRHQLADFPVADVEILLIGNSHSSGGDLPEALATVVAAQLPGKSVNVYAVPRWNFLSERLDDGITQETLAARPWTHVVLQAQKYSTTGRYSYPTDAAREWIRRVRQIDAVPVLFPEWPRRRHLEEGPRIYALHREIAAQEPACVAPVGSAWEQVLQADNPIRLHRPDGNHANRNGGLLTAYVLAGTVTGLPLAAIGNLENVRVDTRTQAVLRAAADAALRALPPCPGPP